MNSATTHRLKVFVTPGSKEHLDILERMFEALDAFDIELHEKANTFVLFLDTPKFTLSLIENVPGVVGVVELPLPVASVVILKPVPPASSGRDRDDRGRAPRR